MPSVPAAKQETPSAVANIPVGNDKAPLSGAKLGPIETETAKPSDWHRSWGKADDHKSHLEYNKTPQAQPLVPAVMTSDPLKDQATGVVGKKDVVLTSGDVKAASPESAPEPVLSTTPKAGLEPAGYVGITDIPPNSKSHPEAKKPMFLVGFLKPSKTDQEIRPGSAVAVPSPQAMPAVSAVQDPNRLQNVLSNDLMPSRREKAAEILSAMDWYQNHEILAAILRSAGEDPAATVRTACVRSLVKMKADTLETIHLLQSLRADADPRVRGEAEQALAALGVPQANPDDQPVHQISAPGIGEPK
jgi:hypothetical protein